MSVSPRTCILLILAALLAACQPFPTTVTFDASWRLADLRLLEAPGPLPASDDLIAAYARLTKTDLELRFDFLGSPDPLDYDLYIAIDTGPGGGGRLPLDARPPIDWDIGLGFPGAGLPRAFNADGTALPLRPRIHRDGILDSAIVRVSRLALDNDLFAYQVFAYVVRPGETQIADSIGPLLVGGDAPAAQAPLVIAFWDTFPAATPAQALRRWSGAHTGPYGQRHGLSPLLEAAYQNGIPLALLDLKRSEQLSALEAVGGISLIQRMQKKNLLVLPDQTGRGAQSAAASLRFSREAGQSFKLVASAFRYGGDPAFLQGGENNMVGYRAAFARLQDPTHLLNWNNIRLVPIPGAAAVEDPQVGEDGLGITVRTTLLRAALSPDPADLVALGGDLPNSPWGDSLIAGPAFRYIAGHPWIHALNGSDLLRFPAADGAPDCPDLLCLAAQKAGSPQQQQILQALETTPEGLFRDLAWRMYLRLTDPTQDTRLQALRSGYLSQIGPLLAAARWNASPVEQQICAEDWDWDGAAECILSSRNIFLALDPVGGRLALAAARIGSEPFEVIGPRSQFVVGLGDALEWLPGRGLAGDPQEVPGAFADPLDYASSESPWQTYLVETEDGVIIFTDQQNSTRKIFRLVGQGIQVRIEGQRDHPVQIPLALVGRQTYEPGCFNRYLSSTGSLSSNLQETTWTLERGIAVQLRVDGALATTDRFSDSRALLSQPEDPNVGYPPGHYIPIPLGLVNLQPQGDFTVEILFKRP